MATSNKNNKNEAYNKIEQIVMEKLITLESENAQLRSDLAYANAKLSVYERLATVSNTKVQLGFGPPIIQEGGNN